MTPAAPWPQLEPYRPRPVRFLDLWQIRGWRLKVYGIDREGDRPRPELIEAARAHAAAVLPQPARAEGRYAVGFVGVHQGRGADVVFVDWWADENELHHRVFMGPSHYPEQLRAHDTNRGLSVCVWDLAVQAHEREAWIEAVLANPAGPDLDLYLATRLDRSL